MENLSKPRSRQRPSIYLLNDLFRHGRLLHHAGSPLTFCAYLCVLFLLPALLGSCQRDPLPGGGEDPGEVPADSILTRVRMQSGGLLVRTLDLFIYSADGLRTLERQVTLKAPQDTLLLPTLPGEKILVGIANSPRRFNRKALERYDAMEQLAFNFTDDDPQLPVLGGFCTTKGNDGEIQLQPLLCRVVLTKICNTMDDYELLENPRIRLCDLPDAAEVLREKDFRPTELIDAGEWAALPYDIGYFPQQPGTELWCYPNDTPENVLGVPRPTLELECLIRGQRCSFEVPLPPLTRGCKKSVEITVDGPGSYHYAVH